MTLDLIADYFLTSLETKDKLLNLFCSLPSSVKGDDNFIELLIVGKITCFRVLRLCFLLVFWFEFVLVGNACMLMVNKKREEGAGGKQTNK